jgi:hypothetical protein
VFSNAENVFSNAENVFSNAENVFSKNKIKKVFSNAIDSVSFD